MMERQPKQHMVSNLRTPAQNVSNVHSEGRTKADDMRELSLASNVNIRKKNSQDTNSMKSSVRTSTHKASSCFLDLDKVSGKD